MTTITLSDYLEDPGGAVALTCASLGWRVFPEFIMPGGGSKFISKWPDVATTDVDIIEEWWGSRYPNAKVAIATGPESGIWVLDLDVKNGVDGTDSLAELAAGRELPETFTVRSRSELGLHLYWAWPELDESVRFGNSNGKLGPGIDIKADGGLVRAPMKRSLVIDSRRPVYAPDWLLSEALKASKKSVNDGPRDRPYNWYNTESAVQDAFNRIKYAREGERNNVLNAVMYDLGSWSTSLGITRDHAWTICVQGCSINGSWYTEEEKCRRTFESGWYDGVRSQAVNTRENE